MGDGSILTFDTETTGVDVFNDRIVTAFLGVMDIHGNWIKTKDWLLDPGIEISEGASAVHGISTERARLEGRKDLPEAFLEIVRIIEHECITNKRPLVIYNAPFDTTILNAELVRHGMSPIDYTEINVVDPLTIDLAMDKYRRGSRKLVDTAAFYRVPVEENAHDAGADCLMTGRIALRLLRELLGPNKRFKSMAALQTAQKRWKSEKSASFQEYLRRGDPKKGTEPQPDAVIDGQWPTQALAPVLEPTGGTA